jgi:hypothetical protein
MVEDAVSREEAALFEHPTRATVIERHPKGRPPIEEGSR